MELTQELLNELLTYEGSTGKLFWKYRDRKHFNNNGSYIRWNNRYANKEAFTFTHRNGYRMGAIFDKSYRAHTIIWIMLYDEYPKHYIDHINGDRTDNRKVNLREVNSSESARNKGIHKSNKSGIIGVHMNSTGKWVAQIIDFDGKTLHLGTFVDLEEAAKVRKEYEAIYGYHENHGNVRESYTEA